MSLLSLAMSYFRDFFRFRNLIAAELANTPQLFADPSLASTALEPSSKFHQARHAPSLQPLAPTMHRRRAGAPRRSWLQTSRKDSHLKEYCCPVSKLNDHPTKKAKARDSRLAPWRRPFFSYLSNVTRHNGKNPAMVDAVARRLGLHQKTVSNAGNNPSEIPSGANWFFLCLPVRFCSGF